MNLRGDKWIGGNLHDRYGSFRKIARVLCFHVISTTYCLKKIIGHSAGIFKLHVTRIQLDVDETKGKRGPRDWMLLEWLVFR